MTQYFTMHSENPQPRLIAQAAEKLRQGALIVYPSDSTYAFGCALSSKNALEQMRKLRGISEKHPLTLACHSIAQAALYAVIENDAFNFMKKCVPGPYTFILAATKQVPRPAQGVKRKVVGVRIPDNKIALALIEALGEPILSTTLWLKGSSGPVSEPHLAVKDSMGKIDLVLDAGIGDDVPTTVIDFTQGGAELVRLGKGECDL